jgi:hypothetical protein
MKRVSWIVAVFLVGSLLASCGSQEQTPAAPPGGPAGTTTGGPTSSTTGSLSDPKSSIAYQFELVKAGDLEKLKECLTPRVRDELTAEIVEKAKGEAANMTMEDLYASEEMGEADGKKTAKVKMKNDRTLTTLIEEDGKWLADTIWFK